MRDGVVLRADVYRPEAEGRYPVIVERVAYELVGPVHVERRVLREPGGTSFVGQNVRGTFASEGDWRPFRDDGWGANRDGYDTIEWAGVQPWSNGKVGMADGSYSGFSQYMVAPTRPPHLKALYVRQGGPDYYSGFWYRYGAYSLPFQKWAMQTLLAQLEHESAPLGLEAQTARLAAALVEYEDWERHLPLKSFPPMDGLLDWYFEDLHHPEDGPYWWPTNITSRFGDIDTPMLHFGSWFDVFLDGTLQCFQGIRKHGRTRACREGQRLLIGPWIHGPGNAAKRVVGELDFGPEAAFDMNAHRLQWYDYWLKGVDNGTMDGPPVRIFLMGKNEWLGLDDWPPPGVTYRTAYLREGPGKNENSLNNGGLTFDRPDAAEHPDSFAYDPNDPMPGLRFYPTLGPVDHRPLESGMLTYTSAVLKRDLTVIGSRQGDPARPVVSPGYGLGGQTLRRLAGWPVHARLRRDPEGAIPKLAAAPRTPDAGQDLPVRNRHVRHGADVPVRAPPAGGNHKQRFPPVRSKSEHGRSIRRRSHRTGRRQHGLSRRRPAVIRRPARCG